MVALVARARKARRKGIYFISSVLVGMKMELKGVITVLCKFSYILWTRTVNNTLMPVKVYWPTFQQIFSIWNVFGNQIFCAHRTTIFFMFRPFIHLTYSIKLSLFSSSFLRIFNYDRKAIRPIWNIIGIWLQEKFNKAANTWNIRFSKSFSRKILHIFLFHSNNSYVLFILLLWSLENIITIMIIGRATFY